MKGAEYISCVNIFLGTVLHFADLNLQNINFVDFNLWIYTKKEKNVVLVMFCLGLRSETKNEGKILQKNLLTDFCVARDQLDIVYFFKKECRIKTVCHL